MTISRRPWISNLRFPFPVRSSISISRLRRLLRRLNVILPPWNLANCTTDRSDGLVPLESLDLPESIVCRTCCGRCRRTAFGGRQLGEAFEILLADGPDADCKVVLTLSGAMTVAKQGRIICEMIDRGLVDCRRSPPAR